MSPTVVILIVGSMIAASCALVGSFLVLRRMALMGDAISHAVLPGIALAFLWTGDRAPLPMILGAGAFGVLTVFLVELFNRSGRLKEDASIGVVFPALFSVGVILISRYASQVDIDLDCVLYGEIAYAPWDLLYFGERSIGPKALWVGGGILLANLALIGAFFKELKLSTFDPELAASLGFSSVALHYLLMTAVSWTVVGSFESVGAILVVAMLVVPPATAYLMTDRLGVMLALAVLLGVISAIGGYWLARWWDASIAGAMAAVAGGLFSLALFASPRHGLLARLAGRRSASRRLADQLLMLHLREGGALVPLETLETRFGWSAARLRRTAAALEARGWIERGIGGLALTPKGATALEESGRHLLAHPLEASANATGAPQASTKKLAAPL
ncbi:MAG: metal ABC transporter permease [Acidobacteriota bacterium]